MKIIGGLLIVLALAAAIVPQFTDCQSQGRSLALANGKTTPMKCHWTSMAEIATAVPLAGVGGLMIFSRRKESRRALAVTGGLLGIMVVLIPTALIGVCANNDMLCKMIMQPTLIFSGVVAAAASLSSFVFFGRGSEQMA